MLTQAQLKEFLHYDPLTGLFTWRVQRRWSNPVGSVAGVICKDTGYVRIGLLGGKYLGHRLAFLYMTGAYPPDDGEHKDRVRHNNQWDNLRPATRAENMRNKLGLTQAGVHQNTSSPSWFARVTVKRKTIHLGSFPTYEEAVTARLAGELKYYGAFAPNGV